MDLRSLPVMHGGQPKKWPIVDFLVLDNYVYLICMDHHGIPQVVGINTDKVNMVMNPDQRRRLLAHAQSQEKIRQQAVAAGLLEQQARGTVSTPSSVSPATSGPANVSVVVNVTAKPDELPEVTEWLKTGFSDKKSSSESSSAGMPVADLSDFKPEQTQGGSQGLSSQGEELKHE